MINWSSLGYGLTFGLLDVISLPVIKSVHNGADYRWMVVPVLTGLLSPFIFLRAMATETLTIMNLIWDMTSDLLITFVGLIVFGEVLPPLKLLGVVVSFIGLFLMTYEGNGWNDYLARNARRIASLWSV